MSGFLSITKVSRFPFTKSTKAAEGGYWMRVSLKKLFYNIWITYKTSKTIKVKANTKEGISSIEKNFYKKSMKYSYRQNFKKFAILK